MKPLKRLLKLSCLTTLSVGALQLSSTLDATFAETSSMMMRRVSSPAICSAIPVAAVNWKQPVPHSMFCTPLRFASHSASNCISIGHPCIDAVFQYGFGRPHVAETFINTILGFKDADKITEVTFLPRDLPSQNPTGAMSYNFTVDVRCKTQDGRYFLVEMQNDFRDDYHLKALIEHSRMIGRIDLDQHGETDKMERGRKKDASPKYWKDIQGIYSIVLTNKAFGKTKKKKTYLNEPIMEPDLLNTYELRNIHHLERHFGDIPNQLTLLMLANLKEKPISALSSLERWAYIFQEKALRHGARKIPATKSIENPEELAAGDEAMKEFIDSLDIRHLPEEVRERYHRTIQYYNDSIVDIAEKAEKNKATEIARNLLAMNLPIHQIQQATGLTEAEINDLRKESEL